MAEKKKTKKQPIYFEPIDYFPKEIRDAVGLGKEDKPKKTVKKAAKKTTKK